MANQPTRSWIANRYVGMDPRLVEVFRSLQNWLARPKFYNGIQLGSGVAPSQGVDGTPVLVDLELLTAARLLDIEARLTALEP